MITVAYPKRCRPGGSEVLRLMDSATRRAILAALAEGSLRPAELERWMIPRSTLHRHLSGLKGLGVVEKHGIAGPPYAVVYALTPGGEDLRRLVRRGEGWLRIRPGQLLGPAGEAAWQAVTALSEGWEEGIMQALIEGPLSRAELGRRAPGLSRHQMEGRLGRLLDTGVMERDVEHRGTASYVLTEWGARGIGVLAAAACWERAHIPQRSAPLTVEDVVAALCIALPLIRLPGGVEGICELTIKGDPGSPGRAGMSWVEVGGGGCLRRGAGRPPRVAGAWVQGAIADWLDAVIDRRPAALRTGGDLGLARRVLEQLHEQLCRYG